MHDGNNGLLDRTNVWNGNYTDFSYNPHTGLLRVGDNFPVFSGPSTINSIKIGFMYGSWSGISHSSMGGQSAYAFAQANSGETRVNADNDQMIKFFIGGTNERMVINPNGTITMGAAGNNADVDITGSLDITGPLKFGNNGTQNLLPTGRGSAGQFLQTDGQGVVSWANGGTTAMAPFGYINAGNPNHSGSGLSQVNFTQANWASLIELYTNLNQLWMSTTVAINGTLIALEGNSSSGYKSKPLTSGQGSSGQVLTSAGQGQLPTWQSIAGFTSGHDALLDALGLGPNTLPFSNAPILHRGGGATSWSTVASFQDHTGSSGMTPSGRSSSLWVHSYLDVGSFFPQAGMGPYSYSGETFSVGGTSKFYGNIFTDTSQAVNLTVSGTITSSAMITGASLTTTGGDINSFTTINIKPNANAAPAATFHTNNRVSINHSNPITTLDVNGSIYNNGNHIIGGYVGVGTFAGNGTTHRVNVNGGVAANSFNNTSDDRTKHNEENITNALNLVRQLKPQKYQKTLEIKTADFTGELEEGTFKTEAGFIAQEVMVIPELSFCVNGGGTVEVEEPDPNTPGETVKNMKEQMYNLNYNNIFTYNVAATQELDIQLQEEKAKTLTLENKVSLLESQLESIMSRLSALEG